MKVLKKVNSPKDIKDLSIEELEKLAQEIRKKIIKTVRQNGGHLASNLGVVELTLALHYVFDSPKDKIIFDVGHQCYTHKLITGRKKNFNTLRQHQGISGFPKINESKHDIFGAGHSSTSISAGLGISVAKDFKGDNFKVISIIGDGALTGGMAYEGLNQLGFLEKDMIVVLNDNKMSISKNVGGLSKYLNKISRNPSYNFFKSTLLKIFKKLPSWLGKKIEKILREFKKKLKGFLIPSSFFEELGLRYIGPLDGHNLKTLIENFEYIKKTDEPILVHILTEKGFGYKDAEENPSQFHGVSPNFDEEKKNKKIFSHVLNSKLINLASKNKDLVVVTPAMLNGTKLKGFQKEFPERIFDVGIAEQHAVTFSAGLAREGLKPVCSIYSTFLQRGLDQVIHDVCLQKLPVVFALDRAGLVGTDGPTHHGSFDISYLNYIPNLVIAAPADKKDFEKMIDFAVDYNGPIALRYPKEEVFELERKSFSKIEKGKFEILKEGKDGLIVALGTMVKNALLVAKEFQKEGLNIGVVNARFVKPLDEEFLLDTPDKIITIEENSLVGGFGSMVNSFFESRKIKKEVLNLGLEDKFIEQGKRGFLLDKYGLSKRKIKKRVKEFLK